MSDSPKNRGPKSTDATKPLASVVRLGAPRKSMDGSDSSDGAAEPFRSVEALTALAAELARFENDKNKVARDQVTQATKAMVSGLASMRASGKTKSPFSLKRDDDTDVDSRDHGKVEAFPGTRGNQKPERK